MMLQLQSNKKAVYIGLVALLLGTQLMGYVPGAQALGAWATPPVSTVPAATSVAAKRPPKSALRSSMTFSLSQKHRRTQTPCAAVQGLSFPTNTVAFGLPKSQTPTTQKNLQLFCYSLQLHAYFLQLAICHAFVHNL